MIKVWIGVVSLIVANLVQGLVIKRFDEKAANAPEQIRIALGKEPDSMTITWSTLLALSSKCRLQGHIGQDTARKNAKKVQARVET
jgi:hypothetical protein